MFKFIRPEFFDIFGAGIFGVVVFVSARALFWDTRVPLWALVFFFVFGILGLVIDGVIVWRTYLRPNTNAGTTGSSMVK